MKNILATAVLLVSVVAGPANATITVYTSQQSFLDAVGTTGTDTFEDFEINGSTPSPVVRNAGTFGYTAAVPADRFYGAGSSADRWLSTNNSNDVITFNAFSGNVSAIGGFFFASNVGGQFIPGSVTLSATDSSGTVFQTITEATTMSFLGFVSTGPLLSASLVAVRPITGPAWPTANNLTLANTLVAAPIPEPATWAMMLLGFGMVAGALRYRRRSIAITCA